MDLKIDLAKLRVKPRVKLQFAVEFKGGDVIEASVELTGSEDINLALLEVRARRLVEAVRAAAVDFVRPA